MLLTLRERERLMIYTAAKLALERKERGVKLNLPESDGGDHVVSARGGA